ncbi:hypothetical protein MCOR27_003479 [Pyricularia oryzae]|uniref:Uncharacterized protein n=1 Tax=Pyricularia grisea TaxID=148305 RepID=A0ABQ8NU30_PYRGI|nr:hypothetical protein MCOR01_005354 [Pyricularia oryzae]KAI6301613.1 hypothetical protein MCOR33_002892 [Pyricularia grisea]KAI6255577.1 hypothetical protein MCOR19_007925 [Pyricularia oryzae]KAI6282970.1 hypothetical protein MCOR27_003479 [Pyricularia oryzae]KAI6288406.1 hypothetical protein MCOR26_000008 [Pyricularia oryzae]
MSPFLQAAEPLSLPLRTRGTKFTSESSLSLTSPPDNTNVEAATSAGHAGFRRLIQHAVRSNIYTPALLAAVAAAAAVTAAIVFLRIAKNRSRSLVWSYTPIKDRAEVTSKSSQAASVSGQELELYREVERPSKNYTQNDLAACATFAAGSSGSSCASNGARSPLPAADPTWLLSSQAQGADDYTHNQVPISPSLTHTPIPIPTHTPFTLSGWPKPELQLRRQDRPWLPQSESRKQQRQQNGMPRRDELQRPQRQSRGVSITPNQDSDAGCLAPPVNPSDDLLRQQASPSASDADNASDRDSIWLPPRSSPPLSASLFWTDGVSGRRTMDGGDTSWPEASVYPSHPRHDAEPGGTSTSPNASASSALTARTRAPTDSNNPTPRQIPSRPFAAPPLLSLDTTDAPAVFSFEHRRKAYAASIPPELDSGGSGIDRLALIYQGDLPFNVTTESESPFGSELSSAASSSLSRASSATSPGTISAAFKRSSSLMPGNPGSSQHKMDAFSRDPTHTKPTPIPVKRGGHKMWFAHESTVPTEYDYHDIRPGGPSSFPPTSPLLPPPPPGSDNYNYGLDLLSPVYQDSHMDDDAEDHGDYEITHHHEDMSQQDDVPIWMRHTRSFGGGVCLACLANGGGFYGENVPLEERRPR